MIKAVIFDCFGVLTKDWWHVFCDSLPAGPGLDQARELNHQYDGGLITLHEFSSGVQQATGRDPKELEKIFTDPEPQKNQEMMDYIKSLKESYKIGMISNVGTDWVTAHFLTDEEKKLFDAFIFSYNTGTTKPDPKIYKIALEKLDVEPAEAVFTDDQPSYVEAAKAVGMQGITFTDFKQFKPELEALLADNPTANN